MNLSMLQIAWRRSGVKRRAHSCTGKFCMSFIQIQRYRYQESLKENVREEVLGRKTHGSIIVTTFEVHISAHLAVELPRKEFKMSFTQCTQAPKYN